MRKILLKACGKKIFVKNEEEVWQKLMKSLNNFQTLPWDINSSNRKALIYVSGGTGKQLWRNIK